MTARVTSDQIFFWQKNRVMANDSGGHLPIAHYQPRGLSLIRYFRDYSWKRWLRTSNELGVYNGISVEAIRIQ